VWPGAANASWATGHQPWQAGVPGAPGAASLHDLLSGGSWEPPASLTAALQAAGAEQPADFGSLGLSQLLGTAGTGLAAAAAAAAAADCSGEEEEEGDAGSERPSKRHARGSQVPGEGSAGAAGPAGGMTCAPPGAGDQPWQQAAHLFSALLQASGLPAGGGGGHGGSGCGSWTLPLHAGGLAGFGSAAPFAWPLPYGAAGGSPYSAQLALGPGASLFNASAAAAGPPPSPAMPQPPSGVKSASKVRGQGPACSAACVFAYPAASRPSSSSMHLGRLSRLCLKLPALTAVSALPLPAPCSGARSILLRGCLSLLLP
jgi:hypothetical protein